MSDADLSIRASFDKKLLSEHPHSPRHLVIDVVASPVEPDNHRESAPLNIALVIDVSGSMGGKPLACAKEAAIGVVNALSATSRLSIVTFATNVEVHVDGIILDEIGREEALQAIQRLVVKGSTNLAGGWLRGAESLARIMESSPPMHNHVILLSDGHANVGIVDALVLGHHAEQLRKRGVLTSTVGIGNNYSSTQLQALADYGGGQLHDAQYPHEIIEVVIGGLTEVQETVIQDIALTITFPGGTRVENLSGFPTKIKRGEAVTQLGMLAPTKERPVIFRVYAPDGHEGDEIQFQAACSWTDTRTGEQVDGDSAFVTLTYAASEENARQISNASLGIRVARCWQSGIVRKCVSLNRQGDLKELARYLDNELKYFSRYCLGLRGAEALVNELQQLRARANKMWDERSRKSMDHASYLLNPDLHRFPLYYSRWVDGYVGFLIAFTRRSHAAG